ncbi:peptide-methionine (S)-S-oxide reductase [Pedobacter yonginense]|uniref:Peptide methionine sulfoxide reductase MsrA n=1 Tax=Pedobacter yonginense TaxID=651869 RepID=A0A317EHH1_9SPHI|nr:peptide-methionine (S)-S-oxide reductase MsrA [Pedobacter yonginense]PWS26034.1 peptide-methionine (S)-S-oxide reductase [Pedobacter yonginense]
MKLNKIWICALLLLSACANGQSTKNGNAFAKLPVPQADEKVATFGGGCFWALSEGLSELKGVTKVVSGYAGGTVKNPTYEQVCADNTGHAESVQVYYNPKVISYAQLVEAFFYAHDPTTLNRQGPDEGEDYRSIAFYRTPEEQTTLKSVIAKVNASHHYSNPIVTEVEPFKVIYPAENYHQGYYKLHPSSSYIQNVSAPKVMKLRKSMSALIKPEFLGK